MNNLVNDQVAKMMLDTGAVFVDGVLLSPCEGDNSFVVEREYRDIPYNGMPGKTKGLKRTIRENATLTVHPKGLTQDAIKMALPGVEDSAGALVGGGRQVIEDSEYKGEVTLVGNMKDGTTKVITLYNGLAENGLNITASEDGEVVLELVFHAHYNPEDLSEPIYKIEDAEPTGDFSTVTFNVSTSGTGDEDEASVVFAGRTKNPDSGTVDFTNVLYGNNRPYEVHLEGHQSVFGSVTVDSAEETVTVELQEL